MVSEAFGGAPDASAVSSYLMSGGFVQTLSASVPTTETAACWVETFGRYAYATNTGSQPLDMDVALRYLYVHAQGTNRISVYRIGRDGGLTSIPGAAVSGLPPTAVGVAAY